MRNRQAILIAVVLFLGAAACASDGSPTGLAPDSSSPLGGGKPGTVQWMNLEGGFWAVRGADGVTYDPHQSLPAEFRVDGLSVRFAFVALRGAMCIHQVGPIVRITVIERRSADRVPGIGL